MHFRAVKWSCCVFFLQKPKTIVSQVIFAVPQSQPSFSTTQIYGMKIISLFILHWTTFRMGKKKGLLIAARERRGDSSFLQRRQLFPADAWWYKNLQRRSCYARPHSSCTTRQHATEVNRTWSSCASVPLIFLLFKTVVNVHFPPKDKQEPELREQSRRRVHTAFPPLWLLLHGVYEYHDRF